MAKRCSESSIEGCSCRGHATIEHLIFYSSHLQTPAPPPPPTPSTPKFSMMGGEASEHGLASVPSHINRKRPSVEKVEYPQPSHQASVEHPPREWIQDVGSENFGTKISGFKRRRETIHPSSCHTYLILPCFLLIHLLPD